SDAVGHSATLSGKIGSVSGRDGSQTSAFSAPSNISPATSPSMQNRKKPSLDSVFTPLLSDTGPLASLSPCMTPLFFPKEGTSIGTNFPILGTISPSIGSTTLSAALPRKYYY